MTKGKFILLSLCVFMFFLLMHITSEVRGDESSFMEKFDGAWQGDQEAVTSLSLLLKAPGSNGFALDHPGKNDFSDHGQSSELAKILRKKEFGFFIDAHAGDGENGSVSLLFERHMKWYGLLVEDDYDTFVELQEKGRNSFAIHAKLSTTDRMKLTKNRLLDRTDPANFHWEIPLYSLFKAMGNTEVDLLILDTTGTELKILKTLPWDSVKIKVLCIAYTHIPGNSRSLPEYLSRKGYTLLKTHVKDMFFVSNEFLWGKK
ncbi:protein Star-like isoform X2 [Macrobrachium rosenbergii]|uniref:protein Star-like isoform X2 n=1 Tax=Macrobrachium rosenbergii TaxID=79674 RepID=UPI0034D6A901